MGNPKRIGKYFGRVGIHVFQAFTADESRIYGTCDAYSLAAGSVAKHHVETWGISGHSLLCINMNHSRLFEELLLELQTYLNSGDAYEVIKSSRVLRQLLLDGDALLHLVNRELRAQPRFRVRMLTDEAKQGFAPEIYPDTDRSKTNDLQLKGFLAFSMGSSDGASITIREVIKFVAIALGGVHFKDDPTGKYTALDELHSSADRIEDSPVLLALQHIGAVCRDALIPIRDLLLEREKYEKGVGWTAMLSLRLLEGPADEDNYILDIGANEDTDRFSVYVDTRNELTFRVIDAGGSRRYLRAGVVGRSVPLEVPILILCELSTVGTESLLSLRTDGWDHAEIVHDSPLGAIGNPLHSVMGSDCTGIKHTRMDQFGVLLINRPLSGLEKSQAAAHLSEQASIATSWVSFRGNQFLYSNAHPNFFDRNEDA